MTDLFYLIEPYLPLVVSALIGLLVRAFFYVPSKVARLRLIGRSGAPYALATDLGLFRVDREQRLFRVASRDQRCDFPLDDLEGPRLHNLEEDATLSELVFGFDPWDFHRRYRDAWQTHAVTIKLRAGPEIPVFVARTYSRREVFLNTYFSSERQAIRKILRAGSPEEQAWAVLRILDSMLKA